MSLDDLISLILHARLGLVPAISRMVHWLAHKLSSVPVSHDDLSHLLPSLFFLSSNLPLTKNTKLSYSSSYPCQVQELTLSAAYTEDSIPRVQYTLITAYIVHCIIPRWTVLLLPVSLPSLGRPCCTQFFTLLQIWGQRWIESQLLSRLPPELLPPDWPPPSIAPISLDNSLQVHFQTCSITASKFISKLARLQPPYVHQQNLF
jgi:hypothetical protein